MVKNQDPGCNICKEKLSKYESKYQCTTCKEGGKSFILCEPCRFAEENPHKHKLIKTEGLPIDYPFFSIDSLSTKTEKSQLFLGCFGAALPNSETIVKNKVKAVLSLLYFDTKTVPKTESYLNNLQKLFFNEEGEYQPLIKHKGVIYYHINLPDINDPEKLASYGCEDLLQRSVVYIDLAMRLGNVLVHCEKGQRRSASVLLSWLCAHRIPLQEAIDKVDETYAGEEENWGEAYRYHRSLWINSLLSNWEKKHKSLQKKWILDSKNKKCILEWKSMLLVDKNDENDPKLENVEEAEKENEKTESKKETKKPKNKKRTPKPKPKSRKKLTLEEVVESDEPLGDLLLEDLNTSKNKSRTKKKNSAVKPNQKGNEDISTFKPSRLKRNRISHAEEEAPPAKKKKL